MNDLFQKDNNPFTLQTLKHKKKWQHKKSQQTYTIILYVLLSHDETTRLNTVS